VSRRLSAVRGLHRYAIGVGAAKADPTREVAGPRRLRKLPGALTVPEMERLLAVPAGDDPIARRDRALLEFGYATGVRATEAIGVDLGDLDAEPGLLRVRGKGDVERWVPVGRVARRAVDAWLRHGRPALVKDPRELPFDQYQRYRLVADLVSADSLQSTGAYRLLVYVLLYELTRGR